MTTIYHPCAWCAGKGVVPFASAMNTTAGQYPSNVVVTCGLCNGTGKGLVKEIQEP